MKKIKILGTEYRIYYKTERQDVALEDISGYCDYSSKTIICKEYTEEDKIVLGLENIKFISNRVLRHEVFHAFMYESGLWANSFNVQQWAKNEEMTDWFAIQSPKIFKVYKQLGVLE